MSDYLPIGLGAVGSGGKNRLSRDFQIPGISLSQRLPTPFCTC